MMLKWTLPDSSYITADVNDVNMGYVQVNTLLLNENIPGVSASVYPWTGNYMNTIPLPIAAVAKPGYRFVEWLNTGITNDAIEWTPNGDSTFTAVFEVNPDFEPIRINEVMLRNKNYIEDNFGETDDWSELFNPNSFAVDLSGCKISKGAYSWTIPNNTIIEADSYYIFWHDNEVYQGNNHISFKLQNVDDILYLKSSTNETLDSLNYTQTPKNQSFGRYPNGSDTYKIFEYPTPLEFNEDISGFEPIILDPLVVYPNPTTSIVYSNKKINYSLYDLTGREVRSGNQSFKINIVDLENGIYILKTDKKEVVKIMVQKN